MTAVEQTDRTEWHEWRRFGIGASDVAGILGVSPWASPWSVWASKVGLIQPDDDRTDSMQFGADLEPVIALWFNRETGLNVHGEQTWCVHQVWPWARATVDGFVYESGQSPGDAPDALGVFESKYDGDAPWDEVPEHYVRQVQWQMLVTGHTHAWLACMHLPFGRPAFRVYEIERDDRAVDEMRARVEAFWNGYVVTGEPPPVDDHDATTEAIKAVYADAADEDDPFEFDPDMALTIEELRDLKAQAKELGAEIGARENAIRVALGEHVNGHREGELVASWRPQTTKRIDQKALKEAHPQIVAEFTTESVSRVLRLHSPKRAKK